MNHAVATGQTGDEVRRRGPAQPTVAAGGGRGGSDDLGAVEVSCPGGQSHTFGEGEGSESEVIFTGRVCVHPPKKQEEEDKCDKLHEDSSVPLMRVMCTKKILQCMYPQCQLSYLEQCFRKFSPESAPYRCKTNRAPPTIHPPSQSSFALK